MHPIFGQHHFATGADRIDIADWTVGAIWVVFILLLISALLYVQELEYVFKGGLIIQVKVAAFVIVSQLDSLGSTFHCPALRSICYATRSHFLVRNLITPLMCITYAYRVYLTGERIQYFSKCSRNLREVN